MTYESKGWQEQPLGSKQQKCGQKSNSIMSTFGTGISRWILQPLVHLKDRKLRLTCSQKS